MNIETFEDIISEHKLSKETLHGIQENLQTVRGNGERVEFRFTDLQKKAFNNPGFWRENNNMDRRHIVVQGATSSGKTLISEMAILDCLKSRRKAIVLVPLKAMVRERYEHFKRDLKLQGTTQVYASSSDFQDHDGDIINGDYEVAIIVYEKFFAMLSQSGNRMLNECALLVVDELQMLSSDKRGPKLEIGIQKVLRNNKNPQKDTTYVRIMCLTTCDCKINYIKEWLTVVEGENECKPILIESKMRPVGLKEHVLRVNGEWKMRYEKGEWDSSEEKRFDEGRLIKDEGYEAPAKSEQAKRELLKRLLQKLYKENPKAKVLIFVNGRKKAYELANYIAEQKILSSGELSEIAKRIEKFDEDEYRNELMRSLLSYKIAFHNAALSVALREFIEDLFHEKDELRLVVATETLTIGMNMPVDVMILYDDTVYRSNGRSERLTSQEYKNFVGRAGRLGQTNRKGESYIFAVTKTDAEKFWEGYVECRDEEICSALVNYDEALQAPYYLSLMETGNNLVVDQKNLLEESFSKKCGGKPIDMGKVWEQLYEAKLCNVEFAEEDEEGEDGAKEEGKKRYTLNGYGRMMAPYAFSLGTCKRLHKYIFNGGLRRSKGRWKMENGKGGLPMDISVKDIENDRYLLDILYVICNTPDIIGLNQLNIPSGNNPEKERMALDKIEEMLRKLVKTEKNPQGVCEAWLGSPLLYALENGFDNEKEQKEPLMRAILLYYWTKGKMLRDIKRETGFYQFVTIVNGDMARLAEAVSYQLEAIYHCFGEYKGRRDRIPSGLLRKLYELSTRVNYGMARNLVVIANCHVHGLDRTAVLKIGEKVKKLGKYDSPVDFVKNASADELERILTEQQRMELLRRIDEQYLRDNFEILLEAVQKNLSGKYTGEGACEALKALYHTTREEETQLLGPLEKIFWTNELLTKQDEICFYDKKMLVNLVGDKNIAKLDLGEKSFSIGVYTGKENDSAELNRFIGNMNYKVTNILLVFEEHMLDRVEKNGEGSYKISDADGKALVSGIHLAMTLRKFSELLAQDIALGDVNAEALSALLQDMRGVFRLPGLRALYPLLQNYSCNADQYSEAGKELHELRILYDKQLDPEQEMHSKIVRELKSQGIPFRFLRWGECLQEEVDIQSPILMYLTWDIAKNSHNLDVLHSHLRRNHYKNVYAIFNSDEEFRNWGTENPELPCNELEHGSREKFSYAVRFLMDGVQEENFLIGVSYAHEYVNGMERPTVVQFRKVIERLNDEFGAGKVLYDENSSCRSYFSGNGAISESLKRYRQCKYFVVLDDHFFNRTPNCMEEGKVIQERVKELGSYHLWLLHPDNDGHCMLYNDKNDYSTRMSLTEDSTENAIKEVIEGIWKMEERK